MPQPTYRSLLGISKEVTRGTAVVPTAYLPIKTFAPQDNIMYLQDEGIRGSMTKNFAQVQGTKYSTFGFTGDVFPDTFGWPLAGILGNVTTTGASAPYTHAMALLNSGTGQPTSYTFNDNYVAANRAYPGMQFTDLSVKFNADGLLNYSAAASGFASAVVATPTASYTAIQPVAAWVGAVTVGGGVITNVIDGSIDMKRSVNVLHTASNIQQPYAVFVGDLEVSGSLKVIAEDDTELNRFQNNTQPSLDINFQSGAGAGLVQVKFHMSQVAYKVGTIGRGGEYVDATVQFTAIANTTDIGASGGFSPIKATIQNAVVASTYV